MRNCSDLSLDEEKLLKVIAKHLKHAHPIVSLKGNPNSIGTRSGGASTLF